MNNQKVIKKVTIEPYGGFGNNLQQIALAIMYSKKYKKRFVLKEHPILNDMNLNFNPSYFSFLSFTQSFRFFYFGNDPEKEYLTDFPLLAEDSSFYEENFSKIFKYTIKPNIPFINKNILPDDLLVVHVRNWEGHPDYAQNPLSYYKYLYEQFENIIFVTDNPETFIFSSLRKFMKFEIQSTTLDNDFNTLLGAKNLATSGVGTFVIAAALMSENLKNFYFSNLYLKRGLNPEMLDAGINKTKINLKSFPPIGTWKNIENFRKYLSSDVDFSVKQFN